MGADIRALIRQMQAANPLWGVLRIHGELRKLGIGIAQATVAQILARRRGSPPSQTWRAFLIYGSDLRRTAQAMGIDEVVTTPRSPWQTPFVERVIGSIRHECLDRFVVWNERSLRRHLRQYVADYHG